MTINVRASTRLRDLIDRAAAAAGKSRSEFMLESARARAEELLLDRTLFPLGDGDYDAFLKLLDAPPEPGAALRRLLKDRAPWES